MAIHVLHGERDPVLHAQGRTLKSQRKLHMGADYKSTQVYSSGEFGVVEDTRFLVASNRSARAKNGKELQS